MVFSAILAFMKFFFKMATFHYMYGGNANTTAKPFWALDTKTTKGLVL